MARLRIASAADAAEPNASCLEALDAIRDSVMNGEITSFVCLCDGPSIRDGVLGGEVDGDAMLGFALRWMTRMVNDAADAA